MTNGRLDMIHKCVLFLFLIFVLTGCESLWKDPKKQGAEQIAKMEEEGKKRALVKGKELLKEDKDFIIDTLAPSICLYEKETTHIANDVISRKIDAIFKGTFEEQAELYASKLPLATRVHEKVNHESSTVYLIAEVSNENSIIYKCTYYIGAN
jgi:hypothetical protein